MNLNNQNKTKEIIYSCLKDGLSKKDSALMAGIDESTLYRWLKEDASFASQSAICLLEYKRSLINKVTESALKDGKFALKVLERRWSNEWGLNNKYILEEQRQADTSLSDIAKQLQDIFDACDETEDEDEA